jgi:hypothetical protein
MVAAHQLPAIYHILLEIFEESIHQGRDREMLLRIADAKERYAWVKANQPGIIYLLSIDMMASYLRISSKHFSRIKGDDAHHD